MTEQNEKEIPTDDDVPLSGTFFEMADQLIALLREDDEREKREEAAERQEMQAADQARAERARSGELGPAWRTVQQRIDSNETTLRAVFSGDDTSAAAQQLREMSSRNIAALREEWEEDQEQAAEDGEPIPPTPADLFSESMAESRERFEDAAKRIQEALEAIRRIS